MGELAAPASQGWMPKPSTDLLSPRGAWAGAAGIPQGQGKGRGPPGLEKQVIFRCGTEGEMAIQEPACQKDVQPP